VTYFAIGTSATNPTFFSQYGPLIAALVALFGVFVTLSVNVKRDRDRYREEREDDYRREQRAAIASIVVAGHNFRRECTALLDADQWYAHRDSADAATAALLNDLTVAKLLIYDNDLQEALDSVFRAWDAVCESVERLEGDRLDQVAAPDSSLTSLTESLHQFDRQADILHTITLKKLRPSVVEGS
jgi:hypothetical protein